MGHGAWTRRDRGFRRNRIGRPSRRPMHKLGVRARTAVGESPHVQEGSAAEHQGGRGQVALKGTAGLARSNSSRWRHQRRRQDLRSAGHKSGHGGRQPITMTDRADFLNGHEFCPQLRQEVVQGREQTSWGGIAMNDDIPVAGELCDQRRTAPAIVDEMNDGDRPVLLHDAANRLLGRRRGVRAANDHIATPKARWLHLAGRQCELDEFLEASCFGHGAARRTAQRDQIVADAVQQRSHNRIGSPR